MKHLHIIMPIIALCCTIGGIVPSSNSLAVAKSSSQIYAKHKGFMVFLNWYFMEKNPILVEKHFKKLKSQGAFAHYLGTYGAFYDIEIGVCQQKIVTVLAKTKPLEAGIKPFLTTWLNKRVAGQLQFVAATDAEQTFYLKSDEAARPCRSQVDELSKSYEVYRSKVQALHVPTKAEGAARTKAKL